MLKNYIFLKVFSRSFVGAMFLNERLLGRLATRM